MGIWEESLNGVKVQRTLEYCQVMLNLLVIRNMEMSYELLNGTVLIMKQFLVFVADASDACNMYVLT